MLFLTDPLTAIPNLLQSLAFFQQLSNLKINFSKLIAFNVSFSLDVERCGKEIFPFQWSKEALSYLGIQLPRRYSDAYSCNYLPLFRSIQALLDSWCRPCFSWFGKAAKVKMTILPILPKLLFVMQAMTIALPSSYLASLRRMSSSFIWQRTHARISLHQLSKPKHLGRIGLPDMKTYYLACQAARVVDWHLHGDTKDWITIEQLFSPDLLHMLPWLPTHASLGSSTLHSLTQNTLRNLSWSPEPMTPLRGNPDFPPGIPSTFLRRVWPHRDVQALEFFEC